MKGMSLPINVIVVVAVAVLVLVVVAAFFASSTGSGMIEINRRNALNSACQTLRSTYNCAANQLENIKVKYAEIGESQANSHSLGDICKALGIPTSPNQCYVECGCKKECVPACTSPKTCNPVTGTCE